MISNSATTDYAELATTTNFSFLRGASHPEELVAQAMALGLSGLGITDRNSLAGVVRAHVFAREHEAAKKGLRVVTGVRLVFADSTPDLLAYPKDRAAYGRLCRLLTRGNMRTEKGSCLLYRDDLMEFQDGMQFIVMGHDDVMDADKETRDFIDQFIPKARGRIWIAATLNYDTHMREQFFRRAVLANDKALPLIAVNDVCMHAPERRPLADVVACIREHKVVEEAGATLLSANAERYLKDGPEMARLFSEIPQAITETINFLNGIRFSLDELRYNYPDELREGFSSEQEALEFYSFEGAKNRYPQGIPEKVMASLRYELDLVASLNYAAYFLTVHDIVRFARGRDILCQGRGSAANSSVCFCLGITEVDPSTHDLLFERFISAERREPPDIDVDFEHERREEVMQYIYQRFGRHRAGLTATVISYRSRSAIRETAKAFGIDEATISALRNTVWGHQSGGIDEKEAMRLGIDTSDPYLKQAMQMAEEISGFPRHLSQHTGGFVITKTRLDEVVPIAPAAMENRTTVEWDKDDLDALGILKIDVLALGMLSCLRRCFDFLKNYYDRPLTLATIPAEEPCVYEMISCADTIGVFQIESRAQMSMLPRLRPEKFYDLVIEVAIVRPGPIQGDMVHPYLRRRQGLEQVSYPSKELEGVLGKTLGVPLFQEQAMKIAIVAAGFTPSEADKLRRAMATFKRVGTLHTFHDKMVEGMAAKGYDREFAARCFKQIEGFGSYGFPESHAASFALLVYASCWFKCRYPDAFAAALINSQPMGFYAPAQIVRDAQEHGVAIRETDFNHSNWDCTLEARDLPSPDGKEDTQKLLPKHFSQEPHIQSRYAVRLGLRLIKGVRKDDMELLMARRGRGYDSVRDVWLRTDLSPSVLERLAAADAFRSIGLDRREALWAVRGLNRSGDKDDLELFRAIQLRELEPDANLPPMPMGEHVVEDYRHMSLSLKAHPVSFLRPQLDGKRISPCGKLPDIKPPHRVTVAGLVLVRQRPGSAKGVIFMTLEDETGIANAIVWPKVFERLRPIVIGTRFVSVTGRLQNESGVIHIVVERMENLTPLLDVLSNETVGDAGMARADEIKRPHERSKTRIDSRPLLSGTVPAHNDNHKEQNTAQVLPKGRNFH